MASASIKRQRKRRRNEQDPDPEFQVAPMVDVLLVLMLFFMAITSTEVLKKDPNLVLAEADHGKKPEGKQQHTVTVNVKWDKPSTTASFIMDGALYPTADALTGPLTDRHAKDAKMEVLIRADQDVQYSNVADLMTACAAAGIGTVTFSVINNPNKHGAADGAAAASN